MLKRKTRLLSVLLVLCLAVSLFAGITPAAFAAGSTNSGVRHELCPGLSQQAQAYYSGEYSWENMCALRGTATDSSLKAMDSELYDALQELMDETMTRSVSYKSLTDYWKTTDACKGADNAVLFYSDFVSSSYNREHVWPKSRGSFYQKNAGSDLHHLRPTNSNVNSTRGNHTMGDVAGVLSSYSTLDNGGKTVLYYNASRDLVEVNDNIKGDVARILLYVYVRWGQPNLCENVSSANLPRYDSDDSDNNGLKVIEDLDTLLEWCAEDPVDTWEMSRNDCVQSIQGNRNVFIDYPEYAWLLFGREIPADMKTPTMHDIGTVAYKINAVSADENCGSVSCALRTVTAQPKEGYIAARAEVYPSTAAEISQNGNVFTLKNVKADCTVKVFFEKIRQVTLNFAAPCDIEPMTAPVGSKVLLPECAVKVEGYRFVGWAENEVSDTETAPTYHAAGTGYTLLGDTTLYALYARMEKGGTGGGAQLVTAAPADWTGSYVIGVPAKGVMMNNDGSGRTYLDCDDADIEGSSITNASEDNYFTIKKVGNAYSIQDSSGAYLKCGGAKNISLDGGKTTVTASDTAYLWEVSVGGISAVTASYGRLQYNAAAPRFTTYTSAQNAVSLYRLGEADKIFYSTFATAEHVHNYTAVVTKSTCTEGGYTTYTCTCGDSCVADRTAPAGHSLVSGICTVCGYADNPFTDVKPGTYYFEAVLWAYYHEPKQITDGTSPTEFSPELTCTRGQVVTFLWRAAGEPAPKTQTCRFIDVPADSYYRNAVLWAAEQNITNGVDAAHFAPETAVTRAQFVTFLWRYFDSPSPESPVSPFGDVKSSSVYYPAILWAAEQGITNGNGNNIFSPDMRCTRWHVVLFLQRAMS